MNIKKLEAVVEAILFSMGEAVEIERLAAAVDMMKIPCAKLFAV